MTILGPLVAPSTSTVTAALSSPVEVTFSPSTAITTGRVSVSPTAVETLSISMTSPTATFCCLAPARTIAYTAVSFVWLLRLGLRHASPSERGWGCHAERARRGAHRGSMVRIARPHGKTTLRGLRSALASALLLDRHVLDHGRLVGPVIGRYAVSPSSLRRSGRPAGAATAGAGHHLRRLDGGLARLRGRTVRGRRHLDRLHRLRCGADRGAGGAAGAPPGPGDHLRRSRLGRLGGRVGDLLVGQGRRLLLLVAD